jgi:tetrahydromethanopterin S-methyltransferase subunit G
MIDVQARLDDLEERISNIEAKLEHIEAIIKKILRNESTHTAMEF